MRALLLLFPLTVACGRSHEMPTDTADAGSTPDAAPSCTDPDADDDGQDREECGGTDCDDSDLTIRAMAPDRVGDGVDQSCDGVDGWDGDRDSHASIPSGGDDCDDLAAATHPGAPDDSVDGVDQDCDEFDGPDADEDGYADARMGGDDCDDANPDAHPGAIDEEWTNEVLDGDAAVGAYPSAALDSTGALHVVYGRRAEGENSLMHAMWDAGEWQFDDLGADQADCAMAIDAFDVVHLACSGVSAGGSRLDYGSNAGGEWSFETLESGEYAGRRPSIDVGDDGRIHVAAGFGSYPDPEMHYAFADGGEWTIETLEVGETSGLVGRYNALAVDDATGDTFVAYTGDSGDLRWGVRHDGAWTTETLIDRGGISGVGAFVSMALAWDAAPHLVFMDGALSHGTRDADGWSFDDIAIGSENGTAIDSDDHLHVAYEGAPKAVLSYATNRSGAWETETVDAAAPTGLQPAIALSADLVHVFYLDPGASALRWVRRGFPNGVDEDCDGEAW